MQTNAMCSLPRKGKFPDQKLRVLLEVPDFTKRLAPRLKLHPFPSPPTGVYGCLQLELSGWRCFFHDTHCWRVQPFASHGACCTGAGPFGCPCFFFTTKFFRVVFVRAILNKYVEHKLLCWLLG